MRPAQQKPLAGVAIFVAGKLVAHHGKEVRIRTFGVGLIALAALAAVGLLLSQRTRIVPVAAGRRSGLVDDIYAAGL